MSDFVVEIVGNKTFSPKATSVPMFDKAIDNADSADGDSNHPDVPDNPDIPDVPDDKGGIVNVAYLDDNGNSLADRIKLEGEPGNEYITEQKSFDGYSLYKVAGDKSGLFADKTINVIYSYTDTSNIEVAPDGEIEDWRYTLGDDNTVTLYQYLGSAASVTVYDAYIKDGILYRTKIGSDDDAKNYNNYMFGTYNQGWRQTLKNVRFCNYIDTSEMYSTNGMFYKCHLLENIDFGKSFDTGNTTDMGYMFFISSNSGRGSGGCVSAYSTDSKLQSLDLSGFDTRNVTNMSHMFAGLSLEELDVSGFNTGNVTDMSSMFDSMSKVTALDVSGFDTKNAKNMQGLFWGCSSVGELAVDNFNTGNAVNMMGMFAGCMKVKNLNLENFVTDKVTDMGYMFQGMWELESLDLKSFNTSNVTMMDYMFGMAKTLSALDLSMFDTANVTNMKSMFDGCASLQIIDVSSFDTSNVTDMQNMFFECSNIHELDLDGFHTDKVKGMAGMFGYCKNISVLNLTNFSTNSLVYEVMVVSGGGQSGYEHAKNMFGYCTGLEAVYVTRGKWAENLSYEAYGKVESPDLFKGCNISAVTFVDASAKGMYDNPIYNAVHILPESLAAEGDEDIGQAGNTNTDTTVKYGIGNSVPFKLTAVIPDSISAYEAYKLVFHDSMTDGLTYNEGSIKVFAGDMEISAENYTVASNDSMKSFTVTIDDAKVNPFNAVAGTEVSVKYTATLNDSAAFKNINNAWLEYSNNPNGEGTGTTVSDDVTAFTFTMDIDKVDKDGNELAGAGFTLYKKAENGETDTEDGYVKVGDEVTGGSSFEFTGLAVGNYKLVESTTPDGYNTMADLEFTIVADSTEDADGNAYVTGLKIVAQGGTLESDMLEGWAADTDTGILSAGITNYKGSELPSTGGMGTMMFYMAGGCIMAAVCFVLVKRKEKSAFV